jgi:hypothetical protein
MESIKEVGVNPLATQLLMKTIFFVFHLIAHFEYYRILYPARDCLVYLVTPF